MLRPALARRAAVAVLVAAAAPAGAEGSDTEVWLNPSLATRLTDRTGLELELAQRLRSSGRGRPDSYFARLWVGHRVLPGLTAAGAIERRINDGADDETRLMQQLSASSGIWRARARLEQRLVDGSSHTGWRLRTRAGIMVPLEPSRRWQGFADAEGFWTLEPTAPGGNTGFTGLRTQIGVEVAAAGWLDLSVGWLRAQDVLPGRPDRIGHAPIIGIGLSF